MINRITGGRQIKKYQSPRLKLFVFRLQEEGYFGYEEGQFQWNETAGMQIGRE